MQRPSVRHASLPTSLSERDAMLHLLQGLGESTSGPSDYCSESYGRLRTEASDGRWVIRALIHARTRLGHGGRGTPQALDRSASAWRRTRWSSSQRSLALTAVGALAACGAQRGNTSGA